MKYAKLMSKDELRDKLIKVSLKEKVECSNLPIMYDDDYLYVNSSKGSSLVIANAGSGKTQTILLPMIKMSMMSGENIIVNDVKGELLQNTGTKLKEEGYEVIVIDFNNPNLGNSWNPLTLPYSIYKNSKDKAQELIEEIGYYINYEKDNNADPFWSTSATNYFTGLVLYLFEHAKKEEVNMSSVLSLSSTISDDPDIVKKIMKDVDHNSKIYMNLAGTLLAPPETRGSIISVFNQKIQKYMSKDELSNMIGKTDFDITSISNKKIALFMVSGISEVANSLVTILTSQIINSIDLYGNRNKHTNILLDEFDTLMPLKNYGKVIDYTRGINISLTAFVKNYTNLINTYGKDNYDLIKLCFDNIVYLNSNDIFTLEEFSKLCGMTKADDGNVYPLISVEELKLLDKFEAVILLPRTQPIRTKLLPDYEIDYGYETVPYELSERKKQDIEIYKVN